MSQGHPQCQVTVELRSCTASKIHVTFRSSVFRAMFQHDMRESKSNEIIIPDLDFNTVKDMVRYVYSGRCFDDDDDDDSDDDHHPGP